MRFFLRCTMAIALVSLPTFASAEGPVDGEAVLRNLSGLLDGVGSRYMHSNHVAAYKAVAEVVKEGRIDAAVLGKVLEAASHVVYTVDREPLRSEMDGRTIARSLRKLAGADVVHRQEAARNVKPSDGDAFVGVDGTIGGKNVKGISLHGSHYQHGYNQRNRVNVWLDTNGSGALMLKDHHWSHAVRIPLKPRPHEQHRTIQRAPVKSARQM